MFFPNFDSGGNACVELFNAMGARHRGSLWQVLFIEDLRRKFFFLYYFLFFFFFLFSDGICPTLAQWLMAEGASPPHSRRDDAHADTLRGQRRAGPHRVTTRLPHISSTRYVFIVLVQGWSLKLIFQDIFKGGGVNQHAEG